MKIEQAKSIALSAILDKLGIKLDKRRVKESVYFSPLREERTASFHVNHEKNLWHDFGTGKGGDVLDFACAWLKSKNETHTVSDGLRWLSNMGDLTPVIAPVIAGSQEADECKLVLKEQKTIEQLTLIQYLHSRGIPLSVGRKYLKELRIYNKETRRHFYALGFKNEEEGYEVRNLFFKGCIKPKAITFIRGQHIKPNGIHIFEGFMDFLSIIAQNEEKQLRDDAIILNSLSCLKHATPYIKDYGYLHAYSWMDNDKAGMKATASLEEFFQTQGNIVHKKMNRLYAEHKDVNAWHSYKLSLVG